MVRWPIRIVVALLLAVIFVVAIAWALLAGSVPAREGTLALRGLSAPVTIVRDARGSPAITAGSRSDLAYALGFLHGQERFFQMDLLRRNAAGELSELVGGAALKVDERHRMHRFRALARVELSKLPASEHELLDVYTQGVNAGLHSLRARPWEYLLLRATPEDWRSEDCILAIDSMFLDLNQDGENERELNIGRLRAAVPRALADFLLAPDPVWEAPLQGDADAPVAMPDAAVFDLRRRDPSDAVSGLSTEQGVAAIDAAQPADSGIGSNSFAVAGALTGGGALLANDPHLALRVPNLWYRASMRYPDPADPSRVLALNGVTLPGVPALVIGSNGSIAWGFTNTEGDWMDWVRVQRDPKDARRYKTANGWATIERHDEVIHVHGAPDRHLLVEDTIWGPIMGKDVDGTPLALAWIAQSPLALNLNLLKLETARSVRDALAWAPAIGIPPQNLLVADAKGHVGWRVAGSAIPLRAGFDPAAPADWSRAGTGWIGYASDAQIPVILDPPGDRLWTANQRIVDGSDLDLLGNGGYDQGARAQQIRDDLAARSHFGPSDMLAIQLDDRALFLARWQKLLLDVLANTRDPELLALKPYVEQWQARAAADSVGYRIVRRFHDQVCSDALATFATLAKRKAADFEWPSSDKGEYAVWTMVSRRPAWLLDPHYPSWDALLEHGAAQVAEELAKTPGPLASKTWGAFNRAKIDHPLSVALPGFLARFVDMPHAPQPGDRDLPRVLHPAMGASLRLAVTPGDEAHGILEMPSGQADNPLTPWFGAGHEDWMRGAAAPLLPGPAKYRMTLVPAR
ncbi:MAG: penicillin acylase family protein [Proteobacteria bacterium]|nr:penicillin acylase family protein [Pseudomonadota bacterium]